MHNYSRCFLVLGKDKDKDWLSQEARDTFAKNMKHETFKKSVEDYRKKVADFYKGLTAIQEAAEQ